MQLTPAQVEVAERRDGALCVVGGYGTGKTTALVARWRSLAAEHGPGRVAVIVRRASVVDDVRRRMLIAAVPTSRGPLVVTTFLGLALDLLRRHGPHGERLRLLAGDAQRALISQVLAEDQADPASLKQRWPSLHPFVVRRAFAPQLARAVLAYQASFLGLEELRTHAEAAGVAERWEELASFTDRYLSALDERGAVDPAGAVVRAALLLRDPAIAAAAQSRFAEVLVDDFETATFATNRFLNALAGVASRVAVAVTGNPDGPKGAGLPRPTTRRSSRSTDSTRPASRLRPGWSSVATRRWRPRPSRVNWLRPTITPRWTGPTWQ